MKKIKILVRKEILDILRDKKTLIIMVAVPILLYPAIIIGMVFVMNFIMQSQEDRVHTVAYSTQDKEEALRLQEVYEENKDKLDVLLNFLAVPDAEKESTKDFYDVWVRFEEDEQGIHISVEYTSTSQNSDYTESALKRLTDIYREERMAQRLAKEGLF